MAPGAHEPVVEALAEEWAAIAALGELLVPGEWELPSECPGWSVRDLVSHLIGIERGLLGDEPPSPPLQAPHVRNAIGARNEAWVVSRRGRPGPEVLAEFRDVTCRRLEQLRAMEEPDLARVGPSPVGEVPYREFMAVRVMDCWVHEQDIRVATGRPGHSDGPAAAIALGRIASAMPFVVGKKAGAPDGTSLRFELAGTPGRQLDVVVRGGRAALEDVDDPGTVLHMEADLFWRLGCGRVTGEAALAAGLVLVKGDEDLGRRVVESMAFMI
ncbi:MAG: maleylpyruvate isomerase family mycothiol-dependent enzyme [Acidimicrobiales bacterium]